MNWHRSLYWRIAIGLVVFLAAMLLVQAMLFTWAVTQSGRTLPGQLPNRFAQGVALEIGAALEREPSLDLEAYVREQFAQAQYPFTVVLADGRSASIGGATLPEGMVRGVAARLLRRERLEEQDRGAAGGDAASPSRRRFGSERGQGGEPGARQAGGGAFRAFRPVPIVVQGQTVGAVIVPPRAPFWFFLRRFAPTLGLVAAGVLLVGTAGGAIIIFGPARRRLRALEDAARRVGAGDLSARAPDRGGDEIASVARAFNTMATDLSARAEALAESDRVRRQLLADVSHELTTPVTAMRGYLETLTMPELALDETTKSRYLGIIGDETARLERIIGDLLDLARLEGGGGTIAHEPVAVADLFARVVARHERAAEQAGIRFTREIAADAATVTGDRDRLEQALQNLASNAIRYAPRGSAIALVAETARDRMRLSVIDEGPGIPPEHLPHLFDRFYKADAARAGTSTGSGLGLSIVRAIVERHGGRVSVDSRPGRTAFAIELPA